MLEAFPIIIALACLAALLWLGVIDPTPSSLLAPSTLKAISPTQRIDLGAAAIIGGLLGARLEFCAAHLAYFAAHPLDILAVWQGGLAWGGALLGAGLALLAATRWTVVGFWEAADLLALPAAGVAFSVWLGCQIDGCAYGFHTNASWWTTTSPDWLGMVAPRWPTQAVGALASLLLIIGLVRLARTDRIRSRPGRLACITLGGIALVVAALSFTRADPSVELAGLRLDLLEGLAATILAGIGLVGRHRSAS